MNDVAIVGLGNIGDEYKNTRHNMGFIMLDFFSQKYNVPFFKKKDMNIGETYINENKVYLIKPHTYINNSGLVIKYLLSFLNINTKNILVLVDDINLKFCEIRLRYKGSSGGHNGLKSIEQIIGENYARLKFGIGHNFDFGKQIDYVLEEFSNEELKNIYEKKNDIVDKILLFINNIK